ncbi:hypothetical protein BLA60_25860 [Actinophytocola xinjiangensis]|uniref:Phage-related protein n=1 Tax=Actinophytocola xinjiangensis TaxID=485602 RepID=A0A7Z0WI46_9PSEU|nr:hypothetical protein [Actinophytocola xinjiangensis]OLF07758.1 hypothetical protein BLA60_25860 [Actinophytocola xinjiangensis]
MASKPTVTLTLAGDEKKLTEAFDRVGAASKSMADDVDRSSKEMADSGSNAQERLTEGFDTTDTRAMGFRDTITGLQDGFQGLTDDSLGLGERLLLLGTGVGDLASGMVNLLIPAMATFWGWLSSTTAATWLVATAKTAWAAVTGAVSTAIAVLNAVIRANPIMFLVGLISVLVGAFMLLWNRSAAFRDFFIGIWNAIRGAVGSVVGWIKSVWAGLPGFFRGVVNGIVSIFSGIGNGIKNAFKGAVNFVIGILNTAINAINGLINGANLIPGINIPNIPQIPRLHTGGVVPGMIGSEQLAILQAGERVVPRGQGGGGGAATVAFSGDVDSAFATAFMKLVRSGDITVAA